MSVYPKTRPGRNTAAPRAARGCAGYEAGVQADMHLVHDDVSAFPLGSAEVGT